ncbi:MAG TPA: GTP-dependent dephospho-CoA kinase family protein [Candidatus Bathyarchaeia archaeon]|nr:GTP-dependent dephospho-CoA kinase family protein [Candidatus Bathyarchaeia archaeon]
MTSFRPSQSDLVRLKTPLGILLKGTPIKTMPKLRLHVHKTRPSKVTTVGDVVSRETLAAGIPVNLRIVDQMTLRKRIGLVEIKAERTYRVKNPAGVITSEAWDTIRIALREREAVIFVDGEEDLLAIPAVLESPENALVIYGQPSEGLVIVTASSQKKNEVREIMNRMTEE